MTISSDTSNHLEVLLVEDDDADAELLSSILRESSIVYRVLRTRTLQQSTEILRVVQPNAILLDLHLPDATGITCVQRIKAACGNVPIIVLTNADNHPLAVPCLESGAQDFLPKGNIDMVGLQRSIGYAIARSHELRERNRANRLERQLSAVVRASTDAIITCDLAGNIESWNAGAEQIFGYTPREVMGKPIHALIRAPPQDLLAETEQTDHQTPPSPTYDPLPRPFLSTSGDQPLELTTIHKDGTVVYLSVVRCAISEDDSHTHIFAYILRNVTKSKQQRIQLAQQNQELLTRDEHMRALTARLHAAREEEQQRMSREVHDSMGQLLTGVKMDLKWLSRKMSNSGPLDIAALRQRLVEAEDLVNKTIRAMQRFALELRPSALDTLGLGAAIRDEVRRFEARTGIRTRVRMMEGGAIQDYIATPLFRILQELLTNVARHAEATQVSIEFIRAPQGYTLIVEDNGIGVDMSQLDLNKSLGILGIHERATSVGGSFEIHKRTMGGTRAMVNVRLEKLRAPDSSALTAKTV